LSQAPTKQFLQTKSMLVITFYKDQAVNIQKAADDANLVYNANESNLRIVTVDAAQGRYLHAVCHTLLIKLLLSCVKIETISFVHCAI
jgi:hypothetical protein